MSLDADALSGKKTLCPHCNVLRSTANFARHLQTVHPGVLPKRLSCSFCSAEVADAVQLQLHSRECKGLVRSATVPDLPAAVSSSTPVVSPAPATASPAPPTSARPRTSLPPCSFTRPQLHSACEQFLAWLGESPEFEFERALKNELLLEPSQLEGPRQDLCYAMRFADTTRITELLQLDAVQRYHAHLDATGKGATRKHALNNILRKCLAFLFAMQSRASNAIITPSSHPSWKVLETYSHVWGKKRKMQQRDRAVFGSGGEAPMTAEEMTKLLRGCLKQMDAIERQYPGLLLLGDAERWQKYFVSTLFIALVAPRSQTVAAMTTESVLPPGVGYNPSSTQYYVRISAEENKARQPVALLVPDLLTSRMDVLFQRVLPKGHKGPLFMRRSRSGKAAQGRTEFGDLTGWATQQLLGRRINPHLFRHSVATALSERTDVDQALLRGAAQVMTHSSEVQQAYYVRQKRLKVTGDLQGRLLEGVEIPAEVIA